MPDCLKRWPMTVLHPLFVFWDRGLVDVKEHMERVDDGTGRMRSVSRVEDAKTSPISVQKDDDGYLRRTGIERRGIPSDSFTTRPAVFEWDGAPLKDPVWVDLFTGAVYEVPAKQQIVHSCGVSLVRIPVYDSPCLVTERTALDLL